MANRNIKGKTEITEASQEEYKNSIKTETTTGLWTLRNQFWTGNIFNESAVEMLLKNYSPNEECLLRLANHTIINHQRASKYLE